MSFIDKLTGATKVVSETVESIGNTVDKFVDTKGEKADRDAAIQKALQEHTEKVLSMQYADTANARDMNQKIQGDKPSWMARNVAYIIDCFVFTIWGSMTIYLICMMLNFVKSDKGADVSGVLGVYSGVTAIAMTVLNFHRGTSRGSEVKTDAMVKAMK